MTCFRDMIGSCQRPAAIPMAKPAFANRPSRERKAKPIGITRPVAQGIPRDNKNQIVVQCVGLLEELVVDSNVETHGVLDFSTRPPLASYRTCAPESFWKGRKSAPSSS